MSDANCPADTSFARSCVNCPVGTYADSTALSQCISCAAGKYSGTGAIECIARQCAANEKVEENECKACPSGKSGAPVGVTTTWRYGQLGENCSTGCLNAGEECTVGYWGVTDEASFRQALEDAGADPENECTNVETTYQGWSWPSPTKLTGPCWCRPC